jgi:hypothetical protein
VAVFSFFIGSKNFFLVFFALNLLGIRFDTRIA